MSKSQKRLIFKTEDWAKFFTDAYRSSYKHILIGIAKLRTHDIYTSHKQETSECLDSLIMKLNVFPEITYEELIEKAKADNVEFVYLHLRDVEGYTLSFCVYDVTKDEISCLCDDEEEVRLVLKAHSEISKL